MKTIKRIGMFLVALMATTGAWADELTVFEGEATSPYVPVYGFYADAYLKCEVVMPADELTAMDGGTISAMAFHINAAAGAQWGANFVVFLKEVAEETISEYTGLDDATVVYEGGLDGTGETMDITFTKPYAYQGDNLLIGVYCTEIGSYKSVSFKGTSVDGASVQGYSYTSLDAVTCYQRNFIPMTTFTYTAGEIDTSLALSVIESEHGTIELTIGGVAVTKAETGDEVLVTATPEDDEWTVKEIAAIPYIDWGGAKAPRRTPGILKVELVPVDGVHNQWTFEMPTYPVKVKATFWKINEIIEALREETERAQALFRAFGDQIEEEQVMEMFKAIGDANILLKKYDIGEEVDMYEASELLEQLKAFNALFDDITTGVANVNANVNLNESWFDLNGRRIQGQPTQKGVYILNGKKVVIK